MPIQFSRGLAVTVALFTLFTAASPAFAQEPRVSHARAADAPRVSTRVELVADTLPADTQAAVALELEGQLATAVDELDLVVAESELAQLVLRIELGQPNPKTPVYVVHAVALHDGEVLERGDAQTCLRCTPAELVSAGLAILPSATRALAARPKPVEGPAALPGPVDIGPKLRSPTTPPGPSTYVGITLSALGLVGALAGGVLLTTEDAIRSPAGALVTVREHDAAGFALLGAGLTAMVTGTALLIVDVWLLAPHRANHRARIELSTVGLHF
jgi:hypothetical protein